MLADFKVVSSIINLKMDLSFFILYLQIIKERSQILDQNSKDESERNNLLYD